MAPLVLIPGLDGTGLLFQPLLAVLRTRIESTVIPFPDDQPLGYEDLFPYVAARLPQHPFVLLGESFGGPLAIRLANAHPQCRGVILAASYLRRPARFVPRWMAPAARPAIFGSRARAIGQLFLRSGRAVPPHVASILDELRLRPLAGVFACRAQAALRVDARADFRALSVPVLSLHGRRDMVVDARRCATDIRASRPDARVEWFDSSHLLLQTHTDRAAASILEFCAQCAAQ